MSRLMSVSLTEAQVVARTKSQTRRVGWLKTKPGDTLTLCRKVMGRRRKDGSVEPLVRLVDVEVVATRREPLIRITQADVEAEGFPDWTPAQFVEFFCSTHKGATALTLVTVIEWTYMEAHQPPVEQVCAVIAAARFVYVSEVDLHATLERAWEGAGIVCRREVPLDRGRIDFMIGRIGVEVKVKGATKRVARQLAMYAEDPCVEQLVLVTTCRRHRDLAGTTPGGKPVSVVVVGGLG